MAEYVIVSRHRGAIEWLATELHPGWHPGVLMPDNRLVWGPVGLEPADPSFESVYDSIAVLSDARPEDVRGKVVYGNIPLALAASAAQVYAIEFDGAPPRGVEYTAEDMRKAGARLVPYVVFCSPYTQERFLDSIREGA